MASVLEKFLGCMYGLAIGDALGAPFEGSWPKDERRLTDELEVFLKRNPKIIYTDDTAMSIGIAESLITNKGFSSEHMAKTFARNYDKEPFRGYGPGTLNVLELILEGLNWEDARTRFFPEGSYGNGSSMRVAPVGLLYHDNSELLKKISKDSSEVTHCHPLAIEGAYLQASAVAGAVNLNSGAQLNKGKFLLELEQKATMQEYKDKIKKAKKLILNPKKEKVISQLGNSPEALDSVITAVFSFLHHPNNFKDAIIYSISLGRDTDTIASMTGAISGAYLGVGGIPREWINKLENRRLLEHLSRKLYNLSLR